MFEIVVTKLPHYVLALYPAIAILIAGIVDARMLSRRLWLTRGTMLAVGPFTLLYAVPYLTGLPVPGILQKIAGLLSPSVSRPKQGKNKERQEVPSNL